MKGGTRPAGWHCWTPNFAYNDGWEEQFPGTSQPLFVDTRYLYYFPGLTYCRLSATLKSGTLTNTESNTIQWIA